MEKLFRIYAKFEGQKQFKALDLSTGYQVNNLIRATILKKSELNELKDKLKENENVTFEFRPVN